MNTARQLMTMAWLALAGYAMADDFKIADFTIQPGETKTISVELNNPENSYYAFEFDLTLPQGITIDSQNGELMAELNSERTTQHTLKVEQKANGNYHFICYSLPNSELNGKEGEILTLSITASEDAAVATGLEGKILAQELVTSDKEEVEFDDFTFYVSIGSQEGYCPHGYQWGNLNLDSKLSVADVMMLVRIIMSGGAESEAGKCPQGCDLGDVNEDTRITVADVMLLVRKILSN